MRVINFVVAWALALPTVAYSASQKFDCVVQLSRQNGVTKSPIRFVVDRELGTATILDSIVKSLYKAPIDAKLNVKRDGRYWIRWRVKKFPGTVVRLGDGLGLPSVDTTTTVFYEVWLNPETLQFRIRAKAGKATNSERHFGSCARK